MGMAARSKGPSRAPISGNTGPETDRTRARGFQSSTRRKNKYKERCLVFVALHSFLGFDCGWCGCIYCCKERGTVSFMYISVSRRCQQQMDESWEGGQVYCM